jgi:hypothetical protein
MKALLDAADTAMYVRKRQRPDGTLVVVPARW